MILSGHIRYSKSLSDFKNSKTFKNISKIMLAPWSHVLQYIKNFIWHKRDAKVLELIFHVRMWWGFTNLFYSMYLWFKLCSIFFIYLIKHVTSVIIFYVYYMDIVSYTHNYVIISYPCILLSEFGLFLCPRLILSSYTHVSCLCVLHGR